MDHQDKFPITNELDIEQQQQQQRRPGLRLACIVMPSYDWQTTLKADPHFVDTLVKMGLVPSMLTGYCRKPDADAFKQVLEPLGFTVHEPKAGCGGNVTRSDFRVMIQHLIALCKKPDDVFVLVYCGHGHQELFARHASLVFSDNKQASSVWLDSAFSSTPASVYTVLNCCTADGVHLAMPMGSGLAPSSCSSLAVDTLQAGGNEPSLAGSRRVDIFSTSCSELQKGGKNGTLFARAFRKAADGATLEQLQQNLREAAAKLSGDSSVISVTVHSHSHSGAFLGPLLEEGKVSMSCPC
ncbi:MAG: hypothetical protein WDW38_004308 [Sanguina aurantia]